jgi:hypothetical protein
MSRHTARPVVVHVRFAATLVLMMVARVDACHQIKLFGQTLQYSCYLRFASQMQFDANVA